MVARLALLLLVGLCLPPGLPWSVIQGPRLVWGQTPTHYVATTGNDTTGTGTAGAPWRTIQKALTTVPAGSTVLVKAGIYEERITPTVSGAAGSVITLLGERGAGGERLAVLDGSNAYTGGWSLYAASGIYQSGSVPYPIGAVMSGDQFVLKFVDGSLALSLQWLEYPANAQVGLSYLTGGLKIAYWDAWGAAWAGDNPFYLRFRNSEHPATKNVRVAPKDVPTVDVSGVHHLTIRGLIIRGGYWQFLLRASASDIVIEDNDIVGGAHSMILAGASRVAIRNNLIHQQPVPTGYTGGPQRLLDTDMPPALETATPGTYQYRAAVSAHLNWYIKGYNDFLGAFEGVGLDSYYTNTRLGLPYGLTQSEISGNRLYEWPCCTLVLTDTNNVKVFGNDICCTGDAGIMPVARYSGLEIYDNVLHDDAINLRIQSVGNVDALSAGPQELFFYRNKLHQPLQPGSRHVFLCCGDSGNDNLPTHKRYLYHNSFLGSGIYESNGPQDSHLDFSQSVYYLNNVFSVNWVFNWDLGAFSNPLALFDYNWFGAQLGTTYLYPDRAPYGLRVGSHTIDATGQQMWNATLPTDFVLPAGSPARNAGVDVTNATLMAPLTGRTLPGFTPGYFSGPAPHMGAVQDTGSPTTTITTPTLAATYATSVTPLTTLGGTATDNVGVTSVTWTCPTCTPTSGTATCATCGAAATSVTWTLASLGLATGANVLTVTPHDAGGAGTPDTLTIHYGPVDLATGLEMALFLNEGSGTSAADATGHGHTGTLVGGAGTTWTAGKVGAGAVTLAGTGGQMITVAGLLTEPADVTLALWVKVTGFPYAQAEFLTLGDNVFVRYEGGLRGGYYTGTTWQETTVAWTPDTAWHHVAYTVRVGTQRLYLDGGEVAATAFASPIVYAQQPNTRIGAHAAFTIYDLQGAVDDVRVYTRALNPQDVAALVASTGPPLVVITTPTTSPTFSTSTTPLTTLGGTATDDASVSSVTWACPTCTPTSGTASGTTAWTVASLGLALGANVVTVTATDAQGNVATDALTVTRAALLATITTPTTAATYVTTTSPLTTLGGTASDDTGVTSVTWTCPTCTPTSGTATCASCGAAATSVAWSLASLGLAAGDNVLTVTPQDAGGPGTPDTLTITYAPLAVGVNTPVLWRFLY